MGRTLLDSLLYFSLLSQALPIVLLMKAFNRQPSVMKWLAIIFMISLTSDIAGGLVYFITRSSTNFISTTYILVSTPVISFFFFKAIGYKSLKMPLTVINILYVIFGIVNFFFIQKTAINSYSLMITSVIIIGLSITFFFMLLKELPAQQLHTMPLFWIVSGFFFSYSGKLVVFTTTHYLVTYIKDNLIFVWSFHNLLSIIANLLIAYGTWLNLKQISRYTLS
jgi:hypothetical protein